MQNVFEPLLVYLDAENLSRIFSFFLYKYAFYTTSNATHIYSGK